MAVADRKGVVSRDREDLTPVKRELAELTNKAGLSGSLESALAGADVFIGVSGGTVPEPAVASMAPDAFVFAMANPDPEVHPDIAHKYAAVVATGRSDFPNQINNVLAFPGIFAGALQVRASRITEGMKIAAANALADVVGDDLAADYVIPSPFDERVAPAVTAAVAAARPRGGRRPPLRPPRPATAHLTPGPPTRPAPPPRAVPRPTRGARTARRFAPQPAPRGPGTGRPGAPGATGVRGGSGAVCGARRGPYGVRRDTAPRAGRQSEPATATVAHGTTRRPPRTPGAYGPAGALRGGGRARGLALSRRVPYGAGSRRRWRRARTGAAHGAPAGGQRLPGQAARIPHRGRPAGAARALPGAGRATARLGTPARRPERSRGGPRPAGGSPVPAADAGGAARVRARPSRLRAPARQGPCRAPAGWRRTGVGRVSPPRHLRLF